MWQPTATLPTLKRRAKILTQIRQFFSERDVLEVETPLLSHATITDPHIHSFTSTYYFTPNQQQHEQLFLQTSPEFAMKRLLASNSGSIFQICKAFRNQGEFGSKHNPEFTLLEWYRVGFNLNALMDEMDELLQLVLNCGAAERLSYAEIFQQHCDLNPHTATLTELQKILLQHNIITHTPITTPNECFDLLMSHVIEPQLGRDAPTFIYDYPASSAALARIRIDEYPVAERFEVYINGIELANGFYELSDAKEQRARFEKDLIMREELNLDPIPMDEQLLAALKHGLPDCSGVALGIDRLILIASQLNKLEEVIAFSLERA